MPGTKKGYDPERSQVANDKLADFLNSKTEEDLVTIPGIGPASKAILIENGITTVHQLCGLFLAGCDNGSSTKDRCNNFWQRLANMSIASHRGAIVKAIAELLNTKFPGLYDEAEFEVSSNKSSK